MALWPVLTVNGNRIFSPNPFLSPIMGLSIRMTRAVGLPPRPPPAPPPPHRPPPLPGRQPAAVTHRHLVASNQASTGLKWHQQKKSAPWQKPGIRLFHPPREFRQWPISSRSLRLGGVVGIKGWHMKWLEPGIGVRPAIFVRQWSSKQPRAQNIKLLHFQVASSVNLDIVFCDLIS